MYHSSGQYTGQSLGKRKTKTAKQHHRYHHSISMHCICTNKEKETYMEIPHRRTKNISEWKPLRTIINQSTRYHIVNSLVPCKMKVYRKLNNEKTKRSHSNIAKQNRWINPLLPYKIWKKNKIGEQNMYRNKKVAAKAKIISRRAGELRPASPRSPRRALLQYINR